MQMPSVGRGVHYVSYGTPPREDGSQAYPSVCRAAIITEVAAGQADPRVVGLCVLNPTGQFFNQGVPYQDGFKPESGPVLCGGREYDGGTWHWPEML